MARPGSLSAGLKKDRSDSDIQQKPSIEVIRQWVVFPRPFLIKVYLERSEMSNLRKMIRTNHSIDNHSQDGLRF